MRNMATEIKNAFDGPTALDDSVTQLRKEVRSIEIAQTNTQRRKDKPQSGTFKSCGGISNGKMYMS